MGVEEDAIIDGKKGHSCRSRGVTTSCGPHNSIKLGRPLEHNVVGDNIRTL